MWPFKKWTPESERERGRAAAKSFLADNPDAAAMSAGYAAAKMDIDLSAYRGSYFAEGYIEILRPLMSAYAAVQVPRATR